MADYFSGDDGMFTDGLAQNVVINARPKVHGAMRFSFRPMLPEDVEELEAARERSIGVDPKKVVQLMVDAVAKHLVKWSSDRPINADNVRRLRYRLLGQVYLIISGLGAADDILDESGRVIADADKLIEATGVLGKSLGSTD